jgi:hypothetical protein
VGDCPLEESCGGDAELVPHPSRIVDTDLNVLPADAALPTSRVSRDAVADAPHPTELLHIQVEHVPLAQPTRSDGLAARVAPWLTQSFAASN